MRAQTGMLNYPERKHALDRVQELVAQYDPAWSAPTLLVGAKKQLWGFKPAVMGDYVLWNAAQLFWSNNVAARR